MSWQFYSKFIAIFIKNYNLHFTKNLKQFYKKNYKKQLQYFVILLKENLILVFVIQIVNLKMKERIKA